MRSGSNSYADGDMGGKSKGGEQHISRGRLNVLCNAANYSEIENNDGQLLLGFSIRSNLWIMPGRFKGSSRQETRQTVADELRFCLV